jgi:hypothetical protein
VWVSDLAATTYAPNTEFATCGNIQASNLCHFRSGEDSGVAETGITSAVIQITTGVANLTLHDALGGTFGGGSCTAQIIFSDVNPDKHGAGGAIHPVVAGGVAADSVLSSSNPSFLVPRGWLWVEITAGATDKKCNVSIRGL